jgi:pimeloyl-ACP methyl ester carboxylesterase
MPRTDEAMFYQLYFQQPGVAEADLEPDVRASVHRMLAMHGGDAPRGAGTIAMVPVSAEMRRAAMGMVQLPLPGWLSEADVDFYAGEFGRVGFRGGLNWYRNIDRNWELLAPFAGAKVSVPALHMVGERDLVMGFSGARELVDNLTRFVPALRETEILPGCGHWTQQERPEAVNAAMIGFLRGL